MISAKKGYSKIVLCLLCAVTLIIGCLSSRLISNYIKRDSIRMIINPLISADSYYCEITDDGKVTVCIGELSGIDTSISSVLFMMSNKDQFQIKITEEECKEIFDLADKSVTYGEIVNSQSFDGCYFELYYKGITQKIYNADDGYDELYKLFIKITELSPSLVEFKYSISGIKSFEDNSVL